MKFDLIVFRFVPANEPIDLLNVAFEQRKPVSGKKGSKPMNMVRWVRRGVMIQVYVHVCDERLT